MKDDTEKYKNLLKIPEHSNISFDLHHISISYQGKKVTSDKLVYMQKYRGKGVILDFYKPNSNIIILE